MNREVLVVIGAGGMGQAIARRQASGKSILLADFDEETLKAAADALRGDGHQVTVAATDVSAPDSVQALAATAASLGRVTQVAHTAGLSPVQAPAAAILRVDLLGTALVLEEFAKIIEPGGAGVAIASMAAHMGVPLTADQEQALASTPPAELLRLPFTNPETVTDPGAAYGIAKRGNVLRVQAASASWGRRGARINSISPGVIATPMGRAELGAASGPMMRQLIGASATGRTGTPEEIAAAAAFLLGPQASFVTGTDLLVDGGAVAALRSGQLGRPGS